MHYNVTDIKNTWFRRSATDPKIHSESLLYYQIKQILNDAGYDVVKKSPQKDGHLTSAPYYIRDRRHRYCLFDNYHQIRSLTKPYNDFKEIRLTYHDISNKSNLKKDHTVNRIHETLLSAMDQMSSFAYALKVVANHDMED